MFPTRRFPIRAKALCIVAAATLSLAGVTATAHPDTYRTDAHAATCDGRSVVDHVHRAHVLLRSAYALERWQSGPKRSKIRAAQEHRRCIEVAKTRRQVGALRDRLAERLAAYAAEQQEVAELTPYPGPNGTHWAIPYSIVACESGGSWTAANPSGAIGPYQLLGHGAPWPVTSEADKLAHHRIAAALWNGGAGRSNWVC